MKNKMLITVFAAVAALSMCLLCGCGQKDAQTNDEAESKTSVTAAENSGTQTATPQSTASASEKPVDTRGEAMLGIWRDSVSGRAMMTVKRTDDGFSVVIHWANSAMDYNEWRMSGAFEDAENGRIVSDDCAMYEVYTDNSGKTTEKAVYTGGKAHITYVNDMLYWFDYTDEAGADCRFVREQ